MYVLYLRAIIWVFPKISTIEKKVKKKVSPTSDLTFFETQKVETFFLTFFGPFTCI